MFRDLQNAEQNILNESTFLEKRIEIKKGDRATQQHLDFGIENVNNGLAPEVKLFVNI